MSYWVGTAYFVSEDKALRYYRDYGYDRTDIKRMIANGDIKIGKPELSPGQRLCLMDHGTRYAIAEPREDRDG